MILLQSFRGTNFRCSKLDDCFGMLQLELLFQALSGLEKGDQVRNVLEDNVP